jgi:hypothetical protein
MNIQIDRSHQYPISAEDKGFIDEMQFMGILG